MEIWKPVKNFENLYAVSNLGKVKSLQTNRILKPQKRGKYFKVDLCGNNICKQVSIHRLVAEVFCTKPITDKKLVINHKNGYKLDNRANNLEWVAQSENVKHAYKNGFELPTHNRTILCVETGQTFYNAERAIEWVRQEMINNGQEPCGNGNNIRKCCNGKRPTAYKYHWKYLEKDEKEN